MRLSLKTGAATAPYWVLILDAAEAWGVPPWEIAGDGNKVLWFLRFEAYHTERIRAAEKD